MSTLQDYAIMREQPPTRLAARIIVSISCMLAGMMPYEAQAPIYKSRFTDPSFWGSGVKACPDGFVCSFLVNVRDINVDALICQQNAEAFDPGCNTPGHQAVDLNVSNFGVLEECSRKGSCKLRVDTLFTLAALASQIEEQQPGEGLRVPLFTDVAGETCPALVIRRMVVDLIGLVCTSLGEDNSCVGPQGAYLNATIPFDPMFTGTLQQELCLHDSFTENAQNACYDPDGFLCSTNFPITNP